MMVNDPVCGMTIEVENAAAQEEYQGTTWYFCSDSCHSKFVADPAQYAQPAKVTDPVCGMEISADSDYHVDYEGKTWYFCSDSCLDKFKKEPAQYS